VGVPTHAPFKGLASTKAFPVPWFGVSDSEGEERRTVKKDIRLVMTSKNDKAGSSAKSVL